MMSLRSIPPHLMRKGPRAGTRPVPLRIPIVVLLLSFLFSAAFAANDSVVFGPKRYDRLKGKPTIYTDTFQGCKERGRAVLRITNGDARDTRIKSAEIIVLATSL
jgi:hypothetical protein